MYVSKIFVVAYDDFHFSGKDELVVPGVENFK